MVMKTKRNVVMQILEGMSKKNLLIGYDLKKATTTRYNEISNFLEELGAEQVLFTQWELRDTQLSIKQLRTKLKPLFRVEDELHIAIFSNSFFVDFLRQGRTRTKQLT